MGRLVDAQSLAISAENTVCGSARGKDLAKGKLTCNKSTQSNVAFIAHASQRHDLIG